ncbi:MAG: SH3 domain-containing protein [Chloroflexaceae bacterium]|nr:SH3 domain-containing protein [Chloroflexaceae bacterium]
MSLQEQMAALQKELEQRNKEISMLVEQMGSSPDAAAATTEVLKDAQARARELEKQIGALANQAKVGAGAAAAGALGAVAAAGATAAAAAGAAAAAAAPAVTAGPPALGVGVTAWVRKAGGMPLRRRSAPGLGSEVLDALPPGTALTLLEGPSPADNYTWWRVRVSADGREGWVAGEELVTQAE